MTQRNNFIWNNMSTRRRKQQNTIEMPDANDDQPVGKRLRRHRTAATTTSQPPTPTPSTSTAKSQRTPASKSRNGSPPSSSLLQLNDKCLQAVFERLDVETLCHMANVCHRFRAVAEQTFAQKHKQFKLNGSNARISIYRRVVRKFGHLMQSFDASNAYFDNPSGFGIDVLAKHCSNNLDELQLRNVTIDCDAAMPLFRRLKKVDFTMCDFTGKTEPRRLFASMHKLEHLGFDSKGSCSFLAQTFPTLEELSFDVNYPAYVTFFQLLAMNPQLRHLIIFGLPEDIFISAVVKSTKSLERLMIIPGGMTSTPEIQTRAGLTQLSKLKKLKKLSLNAGEELYAKSLGPLMDAFAKEKIQLDQLQLSEFSIRSKDIKSILKVKTMEIMVLGTIEQANEADVIAMATEMPKLSTLHLYFGSKVKNPISINGLMEIVKNRKKLNYIALIDVQNLKIDQKAFQSLLKVARDRRDSGVGGRNDEKRLFIDIYGNKKTTSFNVPDAMRKSGKGILEIRYSNED